MSIRARLARLRRRLDVTRPGGSCRCPHTVELIDGREGEPGPPPATVCPNCARPFDPGKDRRVVIYETVVSGDRVLSEEPRG